MIAPRGAACYFAVEVVVSSTFLAGFKRLRSRLMRSMVSEIPPELEACEYCGKLECLGEQWVSCERRLTTAEFARTGDRKLLGRLKSAYETQPVPPAPPFLQ